MTVVQERQRRGAKTKMFGVGLLFLGGLNSMLSWRGGFEVSGFSASLLVAGLAVLLIGSVRGRADQIEMELEIEDDVADTGRAAGNHQPGD